jgi:hypothetical protein
MFNVGNQLKLFFGFGRIFPKGRILCLLFFLFYTDDFCIDVKDASSAPVGAYPNPSADRW